MEWRHVTQFSISCSTPRGPVRLAIEAKLTTIGDGKRWLKRRRQALGVSFGFNPDETPSVEPENDGSLGKPELCSLVGSGSDSEPPTLSDPENIPKPDRRWDECKGHPASISSTRPALAWMCNMPMHMVICHMAQCEVTREAIPIDFPRLDGSVVADPQSGHI
jgi:hypothetical protein